MSECQFLNICPVFQRFGLEGAKNTWILLYCRGPKQDQCERRRRRLRGERVPATLLPNGKQLLLSGKPGLR